MRWGPGGRCRRGACGRPLGWTPAPGGRAAAGMTAGGEEGRGPARAGGSPQREGGAGRRARGHAQDPFSLGVRLGSRPWVAFRYGMARPEGAVTAAGCQVDRPEAPAFIGSQPSRAAPVAGSTWSLGRFDYGLAVFGACVPLVRPSWHPTNA